MKARTTVFRMSSRLLAILAVLAVAQAAFAQDSSALRTFREKYDVMMSNFERIAQATGNETRLARAHQGREAMRMVTDDQLVRIFGAKVPDLSIAVMASERAAAREESLRGAAKNSFTSTLTPGFPGPAPVVSGCDGVDISADTRYALFITKEVANAVLAAAAWVCNEDILGENGSLACVPLAIAADVANGFFDAATFCSGEVTANQIDANFNRLDHIHNDLAAVQATADAIDTHITNVNNQITAEFVATNTHLTNIDDHVAAEFTALDAHLLALFNQLSTQLTNSTNLLSANLRQVMKLELEPEGLRKIVPAILTCTGPDCPNVLANCTGAGAACSWNNVGPLP